MGSSLSVLASIAILRSSINDFVPPEVRNYILEFTRRFSSELTVVVKESHEGSTNHLFNALATYLGSSASTNSTPPPRVVVGKSESMKTLTYGLDKNSEITDIYDGVPMKWCYYIDVNSALHFELRWYQLRFHKRFAELVKNKYLPYILETAKRIQDVNKVVKFYTTRGGRDGWSSKGIKLDHPMTFETLAMDGEMKQQVMDDVDNFIKGKEYYKKIGKVWKRGYLLYGPPGTGKSSLIAAMANYLNFNIYSLNLSAITSDSALENLLLHMSNRSILVVEDIDCSVMLHNRQAQDHHPSDSSRLPQVTLSGLLNAIDGLLSCCGDERIIVFTTNYKDRIDPALLRAGRMDMHICLSYCTFSTFKQLASSYLGISDHRLFSCIEKLIKEVQVSPADVAGQLMKTKDAKSSLNGLIRFLESMKLEAKSSEQDRDCFNQKDEHSQKSSKTIDSGDNVHQNGHKFKYTVKEEFKTILENILSEHGDIAAKCSMHSLQCRSSFLEIVCGIYLKLQSSEIKNIAQEQLKSMLLTVHDLESVRLEVGWLSKRLNEIIEATPLVEQLKTENGQDKKYL
ncbi:AAA-ATPase At3g50940-like [Mercurialis annua]|uniref:AAA-ATPase At3g50940-like n=1 Tax=Mercurialis annua TaxID=3986 RepID=UPI00215F2747|nr:AAA-ATPase At3g50940-like [Mercurialis annua]